MTKLERYQNALREIRNIFAEEGTSKLDDVAMMATVNSVLVHNLERFFWTGFYRVCGDSLVVGPYIGTIGCLEIRIGRGVCGTAAERRRTLIVPDVSQFPGHIACDPNSKSEIVVPVFGPGHELIAVLDIDSDQLNNFDETDREQLEKICALFESR